MFYLKSASALALPPSTLLRALDRRSNGRPKPSPEPVRAAALKPRVLRGQQTGLTLMFYQHGDLRESLDRFAAGGTETYRDQRVSVTYVERLATRHDVTVIAMCGTQYDERRGILRLIGLTDQASFDLAHARALVRDVAPDRLIARSPHKPLLRAAAAAQIPTLPCLADTFSRGGGLRKFVRLQRLRRILTGPHIPCVANHSLNASQAMVREMGLRAARVVPWDWSRLPVAAQAKSNPGTPLRMIYAGGLRIRKGVGDVMEAMALAKAEGVACQLSVAGRGDADPWIAKARALGIDVRFLGLVAHDALGQLMATSDAVLVPSRHDYPEGLPNTIYEGLAARTPVILSDHPSFVGRLQPDTEALFFEGGDPGALAAQIIRLAREPGLYGRLSENAGRAVEGLYVGMDWADLLTRFIDDPRNETGWVASQSLRGLGLA